MGGYAQGGRIAAPVFKQWALTAFKDQPKTPFVAPPGIRWVRIDRATGKRVFGIFPTTEDPKSPVIWEAFQPETEPVRTLHGAMGDPYAPGAQQVQRPQPVADNADVADEPRPARASPAPATTSAPATAPPPTAGAGLPTQNGVQ